MSSFTSRKQQFTETHFRNTDMDVNKWRQQFPDDLKKVVVNIPARSGSTRIKDKNVREICGVPLLAYTIMVARSIPGVDRVIVNTNSTKYARIAESFGAEVPFIRPAEISSDTSGSYWAYYYLFRKLIDEDYPVKTIITLPPTNPFRNTGHLESLVKKLKECGGVQTAVPVSLDHVTLSHPGRNGLEPMASAPQNGNTLFKTLGHFTGQHCVRAHIQSKYIEFLTNPVELIDIDEEKDIILAQKIIENGLYDFGVSI